MDTAHSYVGSVVDGSAMLAGANADCRRVTLVSCPNCWIKADWKKTVGSCPVVLRGPHPVDAVSVEVSRVVLPGFPLSSQRFCRVWNCSPWCVLLGRRLPQSRTQFPASVCVLAVDRTCPQPPVQALSASARGSPVTLLSQRERPRRSRAHRTGV